MDTVGARSNSMIASLGAIRESRLREMPLGQVAKVVHRIVDRNPVAPKLDVSAFNSSI